jgi:hypothetical protein
MISMTKSGGTLRSARARDRSEVSRARPSVVPTHFGCAILGSPRHSP